MKLKYLYLIFIAFIGVSCNSESNKTMDRKKSPEVAVEQAKYALSKEDLHLYFDALTVDAVYSQLQNSISICTNYELIGGAQMGFEKSKGCEKILEKYGWKKPKTEAVGQEITNLWNESVRKINNPRELSAVLETNHRKFGAGTSFVLTYLDSVKIKRVDIEGDTAIGKIEWNGDDVEFIFELDETGWRFNPHPELD